MKPSRVNTPIQRRSKTLFAASICAAFVCAQPTLANAASIMGFGSATEATGISADGRFVVGTQGDNAFRWSKETGMQLLGHLPNGDQESSATAISADGKTVIGTSGNQGFRWSQESGMQSLGKITSDDSRMSPTAVSADGNAIVGNTANQAFGWTPIYGAQGFGSVIKADISLSAISPDGNTVGGGLKTNGATTAFAWTLEQGAAPLPSEITNNQYSNVLKVTNGGNTVLGNVEDFTANGKSAGFVWNKETGVRWLRHQYENRGYPSATPSDMSADSRIVVGKDSSGSQTEAAIWMGGSVAQRLSQLLINQGADLSGWANLIDAKAISQDGRWIIGFGERFSGEPEAFIAEINPVPVPAAVWLFCSGLLGVVAIKRRKQKTA